MHSQTKHVGVNAPAVEEPNKRRIQRIPMPPGTVAETNGHSQCELIDVSALGAQIRSPCSIRPSQALNLTWRRNGQLVETKGIVGESPGRVPRVFMVRRPVNASASAP